MHRQTNQQQQSTMKIALPCASILAAILAPLAADAATLVNFTFPAVGSLAPTIQAPNITASNIGLSSGTVGENITTGTYFVNEPYIQGTGWTATSQAGAKYFTFTLTASEGYRFDLTRIFLNAYATGTGPSAVGLSLGGSAIYTTNAPDSSLFAIDQSISGQNGLGSVEIRIQGWRNDSRLTTGSGDLRIDDLLVEGNVIAVPEPSTLLLGLLAAVGFIRRRR
jgi:hypothetical protein